MRLRILSAAVVTLFIAACGNGVELNLQPEPMRQFGSEAELTGYLDAIASRSQSRGEGGDVAAMADGASGMQPESNETITNNQEQGVDEGDIVKNIGEHLVILRKGRLYAARVSQTGAPLQTDSIRVAPTDELNESVWYDEMLVKGSRVIIIGYRYITDVENEQGQRVDRIHGATEVNLFDLSSSGQFTRGKTFFFESNDYYSGENYASRLSNGKLILYMPYFALQVAGSKVQLPMPRRLHLKQGKTFIATSPVFSWNRVVRPIVAPTWPTFHSIVKCDISAAGDLGCDAQALLGEWGRQTYVSADRVYVWTDGYAYSLSQSDLSVRAHAVRGYPRNQLSFKQDTAKLHVLARRSEQVATNRWESVTELLSLPLNDFDAHGQQPLTAANVEELSRDTGWISENRFAEGWVVFSSVNSTYSANTYSRSSRVFGKQVGGTGKFEAALPDAYVSRIEALPGQGALIVSTENDKLALRTLRLGAQGQLLAPAVLDVAGEAENRSHAFFFKPNASGQGGTFGLPVLSDTGAGWWGRSAANVAFLALDGNGAISPLGAVSASVAAGGQCETSCVDWYGNTRPIFLGSRVFALMGSELQEAAVNTGGVSELGSRLVFSF